jgi:aerotaxis receptor
MTEKDEIMSREVELDKNIMIVSETDEKGAIIYANEDFCKIAGYSKDELIGKPHNVVRHLDMPKAAFKDLWKTIKEGHVWKGIVKNSTKDGDFYWVRAQAYPVLKANGERRYLSVRTKPTQEEIASAKQLYKSMV